MKSTVLLTTLLTLCCSARRPATVSIYGEAFIEAGISADDMDDAWAISFGRFEVSLRDVTLGETSVAKSASIDLAKPSGGMGHPVGAVSVAAAASSPRFTVSRVLVEGTAAKGAVTKRFAWTFDDPITYFGCELSGDGANVQITIHADHLFYDSLVAEEPLLTFARIADADVNADGEVTRAELSVASIGSYDPGNADVDNLWQWLQAQTRTLGHIDGEGHCQTSAD